MNLLLPLALQAVIYPSLVQGQYTEGLSYIDGDIEVEEGHYFEYKPTEGEDIDWEEGWEIEAVEVDSLSYYGLIVDSLSHYPELEEYEEETGYYCPQNEYNTEEDEKVQQLEELKKQLMKLVDWGWLKYSTIVDRIVTGDLDHLIHNEEEETEIQVPDVEVDMSECDFDLVIQEEFNICTVHDVCEDLMKYLKNTDSTMYNIIKEVIQAKKGGKVEENSGCHFSEDIVEKFDICKSEDVNDRLMKCLKNNDFTTYQNIKSIVLAQRAQSEDRFWSLAKKYSAGYATKSSAKPYMPTRRDLATVYSDNLATFYKDNLAQRYEANLATTYSDNLAKFYSAGYATTYSDNLAQEYEANIAKSYSAWYAKAYKDNLAKAYKANLATSYKALAKVKEYNVAVSHTSYPARLVKQLAKPYSSIAKPYCSLVKPRACPVHKELCRPVKSTRCAKAKSYFAVPTQKEYSAKTESYYTAKTHKEHPAKTQKNYAGKTHKEYATVTQKNHPAPTPNYYPAPVYYTVPEPENEYPTGYFYNKWIGIIPFSGVKIVEPTTVDDGIITDDESEYEILADDQNDEGALSDEADEYFSDSEREQYNQQMRDERFDDENIEWGDEEYESEW